MPTTESRAAAEKALRQLERIVCVETDGNPVDLLSCAEKTTLTTQKATRTTLGVFLKGRLIERVVEGSCGWGHLFEGDLIRCVNDIEVDAYSAVEEIHKCRDAIGHAISLTVDRNGQRHEGLPLHAPCGNASCAPRPGARLARCASAR